MFKLLAKVFVITLLFIGTLQAANIKVITKYGKTGGIKGRLNTIGDKVNGRDICPNNTTVGCDFSNEPKWSDNGTPNDGSDDTHTGDLIVRTNDIFEIIAAWSWNGTVGSSEDTVTLKSTLPIGYAWEDLPGACDSSSSSLTGQDLVCVRKDVDKNNVGTVAEDLTFSVRVLGSTPSGTKPGDISFEISGENATTQKDNAGVSLTVTAAPRWNLQKSIYTMHTGYTDPDTNTTGYRVYYKYYIEVDEVNGEVDDAPGFLGSESMGNNATFTFTDDISGVSPNAKLIECKANNSWSNSNDPYPQYNTTYPERSVATTTSSQTINCTQTGSTISVSLSGVDARLDHIPTKTRTGADIPVNRAIAAIGVIEVFIPLDDVKNGIDGKPNTRDDGSLPTHNVLKDFDPTAPSGNSNFGESTESELDNFYDYTLYYSRGSFNKGYALKHGLWVYTEGGSVGYRSGDGLLTAGAEFATRLGYSNSGGIDLNGGIMCDVIDANRMTIEEIPASEDVVYNRIGGFDIYLGGGFDKNNLEFEYSSTYENDSWLASKGGSLDIEHGEDVAKECAATSGWYSTMSEAKEHGLKTITKIRIKIKEGVALQPGQNIYAWIKHKVRSKTIDGKALENGDEIINYGSIKDNDYYTTWYKPTYIPHEYPTAPTGWNGDRVTFSGGKVRIIKTVDKSSVEPGNIVNFSLDSSYTNDTGTSETNVVTIKDMLPIGLKYISGSTKNADEATIGTCADISDLGVSCSDENQVLIWNLGTKTSNVEIPDINYSAQVDIVAPQGTITNYAIIESPADASVPTQRESDVNLNITIPATINLSKNVVNTTPQETNGEPIEYEINARNGSAVTVTELDMIDILPFNHDGDNGAIKFRDLNLKRTPSTSYHGNRSFNSMELIAHPSSPALCDLTPGIKYYYTKEVSTNVNMSPKDTSNALGDGSIWCEGTKDAPAAGCGFTKADVTAIRVAGPSMEEDAVCQLKISMSVTGNQPDDFYNNSSGASATGVTLPVLSNAATTVIVKSSLGNFVWFDSNANGIQDTDEHGINDINVSLYKTDNTLVESTKTSNDADGKAGYYKFDKLHSGDYYIQISPPNGFNISPKNIGDDTLDSDIDAQGKTETITLGVDSEDLKYDAGIHKTSSIGDTIWYDLDKDGIQDSGEDCKNLNIKVELLDSANAVIKTETTANCKYLFKDLDQGDYKVRFILPTGYKATQKNAGDDINIDSNIDPTSLTSDTITLINGNDVLDIDFGYYPDASIGDFVWIDANANGIQDSGEIGLDEVEVKLLDNSDNVKDTKTTANGGKYLFENLIGGDYKVRFTLPDGYQLSPTDRGDDDTKDSDTNTSLITKTITLKNGETDLSLDMGVYKLSSIGDKIWVDSNANGIQDANEDCKGINVEVTLLDKDDKESKQTTDNCSYKFENLIPGEYRVKFTLPDGYNATHKNAGSDETKDSDLDPSTNTTKIYILKSGDETLSVDAGILKDGSLGNRVWFDDNKNGIQDDNENGVSNVIVKLFKDGTEVTQTKTDENGIYLFTNLYPATYKVKMSLPDGYLLSPTNSGSDDEKDSDINSATMMSDDIVLKSGTSDLSTDMGIYTIAKISGHVMLDINDDEKADKPIKDVEINLSSCTSDTTKQTKTDENGFYEFQGLIPGCYKIVEVDPVGLRSVSDVDGENDNNITVSLEDKDITARDFLDEPLVKISGHVRADMDFDDKTDKNLENVEITLYKGEEKIATTKTDENGFYEFIDVNPGDYTLKEKDLEGFDSLRDVDGENDNTIAIKVVESDITDRDFDDQKTILVSGTIRVDIDGDKRVDEPLKNTQLLLCYVGDECSVENHEATTYTDENGTYQFTGLKPGSFVIMEVDKPGYESLSDIDGGDKNIINLELDGTEDVTEQDFEDLAVAPMFIIINKTTTKKEAHIGDFVPYSISVENQNESFNYAAVKIKDILPAGFKYVKKSSRIIRSNKKSKINALGTDIVEFGTFALKAKEKVTLTYLLKVGVAVAKGEHTNKAVAIQNDEEVSNTSTATVAIVADPFIDNSVVAGKVFDDQNENGIQDDKESGIAGVRLATVDGMLIETDGYGRYHIADTESGGFGGRGSNFIIKVDDATLPKGAEFTTENPRVYRVTSGQLNVIDFGVKLPKQKKMVTKKAVAKKVTTTRMVEIKKDVQIGSIYFDSDQDCIRPDQVQEIDKIVTKIQEYGHGSIMIEGNTDARAPMWYNKKLAYKRAKSVYDELKHKLGDALIDDIEVIYNDCKKEVKFDPRYDWWGKPNAPRTKKECTKFGADKDCKRVLKDKKGGAL